MLIELGKTYLTRNGETVTITYREPEDYCGAYPYKGSNGEWYTKNGYFSEYHKPAHPADIMDEIQAPKTTVTESICDADQQKVRNTIIRRADEARITDFATAASQAIPYEWTSPGLHAQTSWAVADAMEAEWQKRFGL